MSGRPRRFEADLVRAVAATALGQAVACAEHLPVGWGNENWRVETDEGERFVVKLGPAESAPKWGATRAAYAVAAARGVPVPELVHFDPACAAAGGWVVRILRWIDGVPADGIGPPFFEELGAAVPRPPPASRQRLLVTPRRVGPDVRQVGRVHRLPLAAHP